MSRVKISDGKVKSFVVLDGENYRVMGARPRGDGRYTCDAWKVNGHKFLPIKGVQKLDKLARIFLKGGES